MDLNNISLPSALLVSLYRDSLVEAGSPAEKMAPVGTMAPEAEPVSAKEQPTSLGHNQQHILVVVEHPGIKHLPDEELSLLTEILSACKKSLADIALINQASYTPGSFRNITGQFQSKTVLLFGVAPDVFGLPMNFPHFQVQAFSGITILYSPPLAELKDDKVLKSKLWVCLRRVFGI